MQFHVGHSFNSQIKIQILQSLQNECMIHHIMLKEIKQFMNEIHMENNLKEKTIFLSNTTGPTYTLTVVHFSYIQT